MTDFSHVAASAEKTVKTAEVAIEGLEGFRPVLVMKPANEDNPAYFNALLKRQRRGRRGRNITVKDLRRLRDDDIELLPKHCAVGFVEGTVVDATGKPVEFSEDECRQLFQAIVSVPGGRDIFDDFRNEVAEPTTFVEVVDPEDVEEQAGN